MKLINGTLAELQASAARMAAGTFGLPSDEPSKVVFFDGTNARVLDAPVAGTAPILYYALGTSSQNLTGTGGHTMIMNQLAENPGDALDQNNSRWTAPADGKVELTVAALLEWTVDGAGPGLPSNIRVTAQKNSVDLSPVNPHKFASLGDTKMAVGVYALSVVQGDQIRCRGFGDDNNTIAASRYTFRLVFTPAAPA